jgi:hypothetical protein
MPQQRNQRYAALRGHVKAGAQDAQTPDWLWALLERTYGKFDFDPCPHNPKFDGLAVPWKRLNYVNPPFKEIPKWLHKAVEELKRGNATVFLVPFRPDRKYFRKYVQPHAAEIRILSEPIQFKGFAQAFPPRMSVILFGKPKRWEAKDIQATVPLYTMDNDKIKTFEQFVGRYARLRGSKAIASPQRALQTPGKQPIHGVPHANMRHWLKVLQQHPQTDLYGMLNDQTSTFIKLLLEPNISAFIFPRHLATAKHSVPSPYPQFAIIGQPPLRAADMHDLEALPPSHVWMIDKYAKLKGQLK